MDTELFILRSLFGLIALVICVAGGCTLNQTRAIEALVNNGVDPIKARCSIAGADGSNGVMCGAAASK